ncbi:MAG TPA: uroporphyrinogen decarboxylase [Verrucomicrobiota bacterium]|nr:uroporphyrinogen decarboxylase [Verrucomicrobiota bacterium]
MAIENHSDFSHARAAVGGPESHADKPVNMTGRDRFLRACRCAPVDRPPVWLMRQAGRCLPEYRALREEYSFLQLVRTPELAAEVTLQPIRRFGFDGAIVFSDILVLPEAMGQPYQFREGGGIEMAFAIQSESDLARLSAGNVRERASYVGDAIRLVKRALGNDAAVIGFSGAPWTLANFMVEGGSARPFRKASELIGTDSPLIHRLCEVLVKAVTEYLLLQIEAGAEVVQLFDTLAGELDESTYARTGAVWAREIIARLSNRVPVILFAKGINNSWALLGSTGAAVLSVDWRVRLCEVRSALPATVGIQGNLNPELLLETPAVVSAATKQMLDEMRSRPGYIVNLGHGVPPGARLENIQALVDTVRSV